MVYFKSGFLWFLVVFCGFCFLFFFVGWSLPSKPGRLSALGETQCRNVKEYVEKLLLLLLQLPVGVMLCW